MSTAPRSLHRLGLACTLLAGLAASFASQAETTLERIQSTGTVRIGYANEAPFAYTETSGKVTGESPEIATKVFTAMGVKKVEPVLTEWGALIPGLRAGRFDVIAAGMYITPPRCQQVIFTDPHYQIPDTLLVKRGNPKNLHSYADVAKNPGVRLATNLGGIAANIPAVERHQGLVEAAKKYPDIKILDYQAADWDTTKANQIMASYLTTYGDDIKGVFCANDTIAYGAIEALRAASDFDRSM